jgi:c-di-GMP-binding flagellar brake protein YcgR
MQVRIHDLSLGGCLIEAPVMVQIGRRIRLHIRLPGNGWLSFEAESVRVQDRVTFAVKFRDVSETKKRRLQQVIDHLGATSPAAPSTLDGSADI